MDQQEGPRLPRCYEFIPLPEAPARPHPVPHDVEGSLHAWIRPATGDDPRFTGQLCYALVTVTELHIGSGLERLSGGEILKEQRTTADWREDAPGRQVPVILGSSLKGAVRAVAEAVSGSCLLTEHLRGPHGPCGRGGGESHAGQDHLCPCCHLFGYAGQASRVVFSDALPEGPARTVRSELPRMWRPRGEIGAIYSQGPGGLPSGRKFYVDVSSPLERETGGGRPGRPDADSEPNLCVPSGCIFSGRINLLNLAPLELHLVLFSLGVLPGAEFNLRLGGGKPVRRGKVRAELRRLTLRDGLSKGTLLAGDDLSGFVRQRVVPHGGLVLGQQRLAFLQAIAERGGGDGGA